MILPQLAIFIDAAIPHQADLRAVILITALLADAVFGEPQFLWRYLPHPVVIFGRAISGLDKRFNRRDLTGECGGQRGDRHHIAGTGERHCRRADHGPRQYSCCFWGRAQHHHRH